MKLVLINYEKVNVNVNVNMWVSASWQTFLKQHNPFETSIMTEKMVGCTYGVDWEKELIVL
jgi:hypothetical protein